MTLRLPDISARELAAIRTKIRKWFDKNGRSFPWRETRDPYRVLMAEMLLRRTTATAVSRVYLGFIEQFPSIRVLAGAPVSSISAAVESLGLQEVRAKQLKAAAVRISKQYSGSIPRDAGELESLPGVGEYVSSAVLNFAFGQPVPLIDGNVLHFISRLFGVKFSDRSSTEVRELVSRLGGRRHEPELYWGIIDLVSSICLRKKPRCSRCPVESFCRSRGSDSRAV
ncbi:MAG: hypothetical protein ACP6KW_07985 [Candidatus Thorarchaeota archaeon]